MRRPVTAPGGPADTGAGSTSARWQRVENLFAAAIGCGLAERAQYLEVQCGADCSLRQEVESLLLAHDRAGLVDRLAEEIGAPAEWRARGDRFGWEGRTLGHYRVGEALGAGGMGLVYRANDERLGRSVALKFLPPHLSLQDEARRRFLVEARTAAALEHPNVCTIHEIGETDDGQLFIVMPLYEGETLDLRLARGPIGYEEAVMIALRVAGGLAKAHEHGVVHRDIKPSNLMLLADGAVKILDFGVARVRDVSLTTQGGRPLGTCAYMSPEQLRGEVVDVRTDIWSLGVVLYEMLTGIRPFRADDPHALLGSILTTQPRPVTAARPDLPAEIDGLVRKALAKAPERRYPSLRSMAGDLAALIGCSVAAASEAVGGAVTAAAVESSSAERRRGAVLVSLISEYDGLVERMTPAALERATAQIREIAVDVVRRQGGVVNCAFGDEIVCLFGIATAHEDDDLRAARAALELHARVSELDVGESGCTQVRLQSGMHAGQLVARRLYEGRHRYAVAGAPAQIAARLASLAAPDSILLSPECQRTVVAYVNTEPQEPVLLLSETAPLTPYRVLGASGLETRIEAALRKGLTPYAGRNAELATLEARCAEACAGHGQVAFVVGDAGAGKSRLLYELRERVRSGRTRILQARCRSDGAAAPFHPFVELLREAIRSQAVDRHEADAEDAVARLRAIDASLEPFIPLYLHLLSIPSDAYPLPRHLRAEHLQTAMLEALAAILTLLARRSPTLLLLEDWHWADEGSRAALRNLAEIVSAHALLVVVASRPATADPGECVPHATQIQLGPLDFEASVAIMQDVLHVRRVGGELARRIYERTGGNPFFLEEICQALLELGSVANREGEGAVVIGTNGLSLPDTVQAVIRTRLDGLDKEALEVLRVASVIGREFDHDLLAEVLAPGTDLAEALGRLRDAGLVQQTGLVPKLTYRFKHVLTREVTYDSLLVHKRRALHGAIGHAIANRHGEQIENRAERLAHHFGHAEFWDEAIRYGMQAAERANALSQFADALGALERVRQWVTRLPDDAARCDLLADLLLRQERLCEILGQRGQQQKFVEEMIALLAPRGSSAHLAQVYVRQGDLSTLLKHFDAADRALGTALRISRECGDATLELQVLRSLGLLRWHEGRLDEARAIAENALAIDRERGDELAVACGLTNLGVVLRSMGDHARSIAVLEEALGTPALEQDPLRLAYTLQNLANVYRVQGEPDRALEHMRRADELSRVHMLPIQRSFHLMGIAHIALQQGRIAESLRTYEESVALTRRARHADGLVQSLRAYGEVLFGLDRYADALPHLREAAQLFGQLEDHAGEVEMWTRVADVLERALSLEEAQQAWERVRDLNHRLGDRRGELDALEGIARTARRRAESGGEAIPHFEGALMLAATLGERRREAALSNTLGILEWERGNYPPALRHYERMLELAHELHDRDLEGLALNSLGVTLSRLRRHDEARTVLETSIAVTRDAGAKLLESHALAALGDAYRASGRELAAVRCFRDSLALRRVLGDRDGQQRMRERIAQTRKE